MSTNAIVNPPPHPPTLQYVFDYRDGDVFGCVADIGWITGHSYIVYGPLANGATTVLFESTPVYPDPGGPESRNHPPVSLVCEWHLGYKLSGSYAITCAR